jgi:ribonuclease Z
MLPPEAQRDLPYGFLYFPPLRVQGYSIAGEESFVQIPEMDVCFDIGRAPRLALTSNYVALTHGHMDHAAGLAYYFSQRNFQGMGTGTVVCHDALAPSIRRLMEAWIDVEAQRTPYRVQGMKGGDELEIKKHHFLRAFDTVHTVPSLGFAIVEKRSKLLDEFAGLPQEKLVEIKKQGREITYIREVVHVAYLGDTAPGPHFQAAEVAQARILITECTFLEPDHRDKAKIGQHLHLADLVEAMPGWRAEAIVLTHLSRRSHLGEVKRFIEEAVPASQRQRLFLLMDNRANRARYQQQVEDARAQEEARAKA